MTEDERNDLLIRLDERTEGLVNSMNNHLFHHETFESKLETRLDDLASRNVFTPIIKLAKWLIK